MILTIDTFFEKNIYFCILIRHFDRSGMKWSEVEKSSINGNNMKKVIKQ